MSDLKSFIKQAALLALPIAMQNLLTSCGSLVDTAMIVPLGDVAISAVGVASRLTFLTNVIGFGFCSGMSTMIAQYWGVGDRRGIHRSYGVALSVSFSLSLVLLSLFYIFTGFFIGLFGPAANVAATAVDYLKIVAFSIPFVMYSSVTCAALRSTEKVFVPLLSSSISVCVNVFCNYCLIFGNCGMPQLGVIGAAYGTVIGCGVQAIIVFAFVVFGKNPIKASLKETFGFGRVFAKNFFKTASPVLLNECLWAIGANGYTMVLARQSTEKYAGYTIFETVQQLVFVFFVGLCTAAAIMIGKSVGRGDNEGAYRDAKRFLIMTPLFGLFLGGTMALLRNYLLMLFDFETETARGTASALILFYGLWIVIRMIPYTSICGIFRAGGDTKTGCKIELATMYALCLPCVITAGILLKLPFFWIVVIMFAADDIPKGILCIKHFVSKKWMINLTRR